MTTLNKISKEDGTSVDQMILFQNRVQVSEGIPIKVHNITDNSIIIVGTYMDTYYANQNA